MEPEEVKKFLKILRLVKDTSVLNEPFNGNEREGETLIQYKEQLEKYSLEFLLSISREDKIQAFEILDGNAEPNYDDSTLDITFLKKLKQIISILGKQNKKRLTTEESTTIKKQKTDSKGPKFQCTFFLKKKNRYCRMGRKETDKFCPEHANNQETKSDDKRIPCPKDPTHTIWANNLEKHLKKCNKIKIENKVLVESWYKKDLNVCNKITKEKLEETLKTGSPMDHKTEEYYKYWIPILESGFEKLLEILNVGRTLPLEDKSSINTNSEAIDARLNELTNQKHIIQQSSLIGHLRENKLYDNVYNYVEFGCGRAELSRYLAKDLVYHGLETGNKLMPGFLLVDRSTARMKMDGKIIKDFEEVIRERNLDIMSSPFVKRVKIDIKDLFLDDILQTPEYHPKIRKFVGISKHLCGCATDLTLECISNSKLLKTDSFQGLLVAMCCRHACDYDLFLPESHELFAQLFPENHSELRLIFNVIKKLVSWATCGRRSGMLDDDVNNHPSKLSIKQREEFGLKIRRIIDECRLYAVEKRGFKAKICRYVKEDVSLENICLIIYK